MKTLLITKEDVIPSREDFEVIGVFNPGCITVGNKTILLLRVAERPIQKAEECISIPLLDEKSDDIIIKTFNKNDKSYDFSDARVIVGDECSYLTSMSHLRIAESIDGKNFIIDKKPTILPSGKYERYGIEDPRISFVDGIYNICYSCSSEYGILNGLIQTTDFVTFTRKGYMFHPDNKDVVIFPEKINGKYYALHRPSISQFGQRNMWIAESENLVSWGNHKVVITPRKDCFDSERVGAGCVPILTEEGWLEFYHGASLTNGYAMGAVLLDKRDPSIVLGRTKDPIVFPTEENEKKGFFGNVIFSCGCIVCDDFIEMYYGAADECVMKTTLKLTDVMSKLV